MTNQVGMLYNLIIFFIDTLNSFLHQRIFGTVEMRKQRKMGHITIVGPSLGIVESQLKSMLTEESTDNLPAGVFLNHLLVLLFLI